MRKLMIATVLTASVALGGAAFAQAESNNSVNATGAWQNNYQYRHESFRGEESAQSILMSNGSTVAKRKAARIAAAKAKAEAKARAAEAETRPTA
ncbi:hypothetical protein [Caulobacter sp. NIBR2454]|uniref:hypothetical protein n=1 Tax=Caulobacter sp. NIBR2454 TaxID=3015996 RepID=UPI0022B709AF|nr:hypothetical protein [Caulobacter sp. NIBR2454]